MKTNRVIEYVLRAKNELTPQLKELTADLSASSRAANIAKMSFRGLADSTLAAQKAAMVATKANKLMAGSNYSLSTSSNRVNESNKHLISSNTSITRATRLAVNANKNLADSFRASASASTSLASASRAAGHATENFSKKKEGSVAGVMKNVAVLYLLSRAIGSVTSGLSSVVATGADFEQSLANTKAILQPTAVEFFALAQAAKEMGQTTVFTSSEAAQAQTELGKLGFNTGQILLANNDILTMAAAANLDMATAAVTAATVLRQFGMDASQTGEVVDIAAKSFSISALQADIFAESMGYVGPAARQAGVSLADTTAMLAVLADNGVKGSRAGTGLRRILMELSNESSNASKAIRGVNPNAETMKEKFDALAKAGLDNASATKLFRMEASTAAMILANSTNDIERYGKQLEYTAEGAKGFAQRVADIQLDTFSGDVKLAKSQLEAVQIALFEAFGPAARTIVQEITVELGKLREWVEENPDKLRDWGNTAVKAFEVANKTARIFLKTLEDVGDAIHFVYGSRLDFDAANALTREVNSYAKAAANAAEAKKKLDEIQSGPYTKKSRQAGVIARELKEYEKEMARFKASALSKEATLEMEITLAGESSDEGKRLRGILDASREAIRSGKMYQAVVKENMNTEIARIKKVESARGLSKRDTVERDESGNLDVQAMKDAQREAVSLQKRADEQFKKLSRDRELAGLDSNEKARKQLEFYWQDVLALELNAGGARVDQLKLMQGEAMANLIIEQETKEMEIRREAANKLYEELIQNSKSQEEILWEGYETKRAMLEEFHHSTEELTKQHYQALELLDMERMQSAADLVGGLSSLLGTVAGKNKILLGMSKTLATKKAIMSTYAAANDAMMLGGGFPWGAINAATTVTMGLANVARINGIKFAQGSKSPDAVHGRVPGNSYMGDKVPIWVNSGEKVLTRKEADEHDRGLQGGAVTITYSPTYYGSTSALEKRQDEQRFKTNVSKVLKSRNFANSQSRIM